jgi:DNA replication and repair protein RecF
MRLSLYQFKHYSNQNLQLEESLQVVVGNNGSGKSTLCEAISILVNASNSHHTNWEQKCSFNAPLIKRDWGGLSNEWALRWELGETLFQSIFDGKNRSPKWYMGEQSCSKPKYEDKMPYRAFWIQSDHLRVISGEPSERRNFLDEMLVFASPVYDKILKNYRTALTSRNRVIQSILDKEATKWDLSSWNTLLAEYAVQVIHERRKFFEWMGNENKKNSDNAPLWKGEMKGDWIDPDANFIKKIPPTPLSQGGIWLNLPGPVKIELMERHPLDEVTKEQFMKLLADYTERDLVVGRTTVGPHLDEISFSVNIWGVTEVLKIEQGEKRVFETKEVCVGADDQGEKTNWRSHAKIFSASDWHNTKYILSRWENKILLLAFIRLLGKYVLEISGKKPFFLLDDVLSELDEKHIQILCSLFTDATCIMTTQPNHTAGLPESIVKIEL